jgi:choice-of-anchor C domain-containing protein
VADPNNLIVNSNFASPTSPTNGYNSYGAGSTAITGWTVEAGNVDDVSNGLWQYPAGDPSSVQSIDLNGTVAGQISQTFPTVAGETYFGSFELAGNVGGAPAVKTGQVILNGYPTNFSFDTTGKTTSNMGWEQENFSFTATGSTSTISFVSAIPSGDFGPVITDVVVDPPVAPVIATDPNIVSFQTSAAGAPATFTAPAASDPNPGGGALTSTCLPASGSTFPVGTTTVTCTASANGLSSTSTFSVKVIKIVSTCQGLPLDDPGYLTQNPNAGANVASTPCASATYNSGATGPIDLVPGIPLLGVNPTGALAAILHATTTLSQTSSAASASTSDTIASATITAPGLTLTANGINSQATSSLSGTSCTSGVTSGSSTIASLAINGTPITVGSGPLVINLGVASIYINQQVTVGNTITQRAIYVQVLGTYLTVGQAVAGVACG